MRQLFFFKNNPSIKKNCVHIDGLGSGYCAIYSYGMTDIPAFIEEEYMLSKVNYVSRIAFDLISYTEPSGIKKTTQQLGKKLISN